MRLWLVGLLMGTRLWLWPVVAGEPTVEAKDLPRVPPVEPENALGTFQVKAGFRLELVAAEPLVADPIALSFDEDGRLFVVEMRDYSERRDERLGRIRRLEDTDGDGRFDRSAVYAENLPWPTAVFCYGGGVFVGCTPDVFFLKDTDNDGKADERRLVFAGFAAGSGRLNVQALLNSFNWGLDNRIHGAAGLSGGRVVPAMVSNAEPVELRGKDFSFDPRDLTRIRAETGGGQHGLSFDDVRRKYVCHNSYHIRLVMYEERYAGWNPHFAMPPALLDIGVDGPAAPVFRLSPDEPWRVIRTAWRVAGQVPGPIEGGGRPSGYFTSATGITIYRGNAFPEEYRGDAFIADVGSNLIHRKKLTPEGVAWVAKRPRDEEAVEFIASRDLWFRPVQFANAPDGTLYVADMYREVIEHPWSIPESIKKHLDLNSGNDRGRIYRIVPENFKQPKPPKLSAASTAQLAALLEHPNGWHRDTAARLLYERQDKSAVQVLETLAAAGNSLGRLHALWALAGQAELKPSHVMKALSDPDPRVLEQAVRLAETFPWQGSAGKGPLLRKLMTLATNSSARVRYTLALALGPLDIEDDDRCRALMEIALRDRESPYVRAAVLNSLATGAGAMLAATAGRSQFRSSPGGREFLKELFGLIGTKNNPKEVSQALRWLEREEEPAQAFRLIRSLGEGWRRAGSDQLDTERRGRLRPLFESASLACSDSRLDETMRIEAIDLLALTRFEESGERLLALLAPVEPQRVQLAAIGALRRFAGTDGAAGLVRRWQGLTPAVRLEALGLFLSRPERARVLLEAIEAGTIRTTDLPSTQVEFLRSHRDGDLRERAAKLFGIAPGPHRAQALAALTDALTLKGDSRKGRELYLTRCALCHRLGGDGYALGPDLASVASSGKEALLINILDPNRQVAPNYLNYVADTIDGESAMGLVMSETATSVTLRQAGGLDKVLPRAQIRSLQSQGKSAMPEGLEAGLTAQDLADLLECIASAGDVKKSK